MISASGMIDKTAYMILFDPESGTLGLGTSKFGEKSSFATVTLTCEHASRFGTALLEYADMKDEEEV